MLPLLAMDATAADCVCWVSPAANEQELARAWSKHNQWANDLPQGIRMISRKRAVVIRLLPQDKHIVFEARSYTYGICLKVAATSDKKDR